MYTNSMRVIIAILFSLILPVLVTAQGAYSSVPFDTNQTRLPRNYLGHNAVLLAAPLTVLGLEVKRGCDRFEKTEECQARMNSLYERRLTKQLSARDTLAFQMGSGWCDYSADSETLICEAPMSKRYQWQNKLIRTSRYAGQNAYGAKATITLKQFENVIIKPTPNAPRIVMLKLPRVRARSMFENLRVLLVGQAKQPFSVFTAVDYRPTFNDPVHVKGDNYELPFQLNQVWLYDMATGEVLVKRVIASEESSRK